MKSRAEKKFQAKYKLFQKIEVCLSVPSDSENSEKSDISETELTVKLLLTCSDPKGFECVKMADPETQTEPLVGPPAQGPRSSRAYKVAGLTFLACVLIVGQAAIAYFLLSQKSDIKSLQEENNKINTELTRGRSASVPMQMHMPMSAMTEMLDDTLEEEASTGTPGKTSAPLTTCQLEFAGLKPVQVPGFQPKCDKNGLYERQQCYMRQCWCVSPADGQQIPGSLRQGRTYCGARAIPGGLLALSNE